LGRVKGFIKELFIGAVLIFIVSNIISYVRKPVLDSNTLATLNVTLIDGSQYSLKKGKLLLVHFWATWCPTCRLEASNIETVSGKYEVLTIAVNSGDNATIQTYMHDRDLHFRVVNDNKGTWARQFHVEAYPTTFIYDTKGNLRFTEVGYTSTVGLLGRLKMIE